MKRLKILILSGSIPYPLDDGGKIILFNLIKRLSLFHNITLLALINSKERKRYISNLDKYCSVETVIYKKKDNNINRVKYLFSLQPYGINLYRDNKLKQRLNKLLHKSHFDIIHSHCMHMTQYVSEQLDIPKLLYATDCDSLLYYKRVKREKDLSKKIYLWWQWYRHVRYEKKIYKRFNAAIVVSEADCEALKKNIPEVPVTVAPNGVDTDYYKCNGNPRKELSIIFTGLMNYHPNISSVLSFYRHIYPIVKRRMPEIKFYVVGKNPTKEIIDLQKRDKDIIVTGYVDDIRPYLRKSSVFVCYMLEGGGIKNKILEAMSMGLPVVANSTAINGIDALDGGDFLKANLPGEFAEKTILLLNDKNLADTISSNARNFVIKRHSWDRAARIVDEVYRRISQAA